MQRNTRLVAYLLVFTSLGCQPKVPDSLPAVGVNIQVDSVFATYRTLPNYPYRESTSIFYTTSGFAFDKADNLYFADMTGNRIGQLTPDLTLSTFAGTGKLGDSDGPLNQATFFSPTDLKFDPNGRLTIATNYAIRRVQSDGTVKTILGTGASNYPKTLAGLFYIAFDQVGNLYAVNSNSGTATDWKERGPKVLKITPDHRVTVLLREYKDSTLTNKWYDEPRSLAVDSKSNLFIDAGSYGILKITPQGEVTTFVGTALHPKTKLAIEKSLCEVSGLVIDKDDNLLFSDSPYLFKATPDGQVNIIAGKEKGAYTGRGDQVYFGHLDGMALDSKGDLYTTNSFYNTIYRVRFNN